jgi:hypothetical protein
METVIVPETTRDVEVSVACDICNGVIGLDFYKVDEIEVRHKTGYSYPDGGSGEEITFDLCGRCFDKKLIPWLRSQGAAPQIKEWDF